MSPCKSQSYGVDITLHFMKKQDLKHTIVDVLAIIISWVIAIGMVYVVYLKIRLLYHI